MGVKYVLRMKCILIMDNPPLKSGQVELPAQFFGDSLFGT
jgi:hypothetical protein